MRGAGAKGEGLALWEAIPETVGVAEPMAVLEDEAPLTVTQVAAAVQRLVEGSLGRVRVQGEVSKLTVHGNGHVYFDVKDAGAVLNCVAWRSSVAKWAKLPQTGDMVVLRGRMGTYAQRSNYQLSVDSFAPAGLGALLQKLEELKAKLAAEGLFDAGRKRMIPFLPRRIGIVTSPTGAVIADVLSRLEARCPRDVILAPAVVQGAGAAASVVRALEALNGLPDEARPDVILVVRGGGSVEDLMPFNDEALVRAVAASAVPVVSGVGHEPDVTLCDHAADVRAATPTAAAELAVPVRAELLEQLGFVRRRLGIILRERMAFYEMKVRHAAQLLARPDGVVEAAKGRLEGLNKRLILVRGTAVVGLLGRVEALERVLEVLHPRNPLKRGYALVHGAQGLVTRAADAKGLVSLEFLDGMKEAEVR